jgi:ankyrin repeat protein
VSHRFQDSKGRTALHWAGVLGNAETASVILKYGGSGTVKNNDGFSFYDVAKAPGPIHPGTFPRDHFGKVW